MLARLIDELAVFAAQIETEIAAASQEWGLAAGRVFADDAIYEERTSAFLEWFAIDRPGADGVRPIERFARESALREAESQAWLTALRNSYTSVFEVTAISGEQVLVADRLGGGIFSLDERRRHLGFMVHSLIEARLCPNPHRPPSLLFTRTISVHPTQAYRAILDFLRRSAEQKWPRERVLFALRRMRVKTMRYAHVDARRIYSEQSLAE